jgi:hypothetical protein
MGKKESIGHENPVVAMLWWWIPTIAARLFYSYFETGTIGLNGMTVNIALLFLSESIIAVYMPRGRQYLFLRLFLFSIICLFGVVVLDVFTGTSLIWIGYIAYYSEGSQTTIPDVQRLFENDYEAYQECRYSGPRLRRPGEKYGHFWKCTEANTLSFVGKKNPDTRVKVTYDGQVYGDNSQILREKRKVTKFTCLVSFSSQMHVPEKTIVSAVAAAEARLAALAPPVSYPHGWTEAVEDVCMQHAERLIDHGNVDFDTFDFEYTLYSKILPRHLMMIVFGYVGLIDTAFSTEIIPEKPLEYIERHKDQWKSVKRRNYLRALQMLRERLTVDPEVFTQVDLEWVKKHYLSNKGKKNIRVKMFAKREKLPHKKAQLEWRTAQQWMDQAIGWVKARSIAVPTELCHLICLIYGKPLKNRLGELMNTRLIYASNDQLDFTFASYSGVTSVDLSGWMSKSIASQSFGIDSMIVLGDDRLQVVAEHLDVQHIPTPKLTMKLKHPGRYSTLHTKPIEARQLLFHLQLYVRPGSLIIEPFAGIGGDTIFLTRAYRVRAFEIANDAYQNLHHNMKIYGNMDNLNITLGNMSSYQKADAYYFDPPWGNKKIMSTMKTRISRALDVAKVVFIKWPRWLTPPEIEHLGYKVITIKREWSWLLAVVPSNTPEYRRDETVTSTREDPGMSLMGGIGFEEDDFSMYDQTQRNQKGEEGAMTAQHWLYIMLGVPWVVMALSAEFCMKSMEAVGRLFPGGPICQITVFKDFLMRYSGMWDTSDGNSLNNLFSESYRRWCRNCVKWTGYVLQLSDHVYAIDVQKTTKVESRDSLEPFQRLGLKIKPSASRRRERVTSVSFLKTAWTSNLENYILPSRVLKAGCFSDTIPFKDRALFLKGVVASWGSVGPDYPILGAWRTMVERCCGDDYSDARYEDIQKLEYQVSYEGSASRDELLTAMIDFYTTNGKSLEGEVSVDTYGRRYASDESREPLSARDFERLEYKISQITKEDLLGPGWHISDTLIDLLMTTDY